MNVSRSFFALSILALSAPAAVAQTQDEFFDDSYIHEFRIEVKPSDFDLLRLHYLDNTYYTANFHWIYTGKDGVRKDIVLSEVGIRSRGRGSRSPIKPNLRVDINRYSPAQTYLGLKSFVLKANNQDASMLKERSVFKLWDRTGLPASREAFVRLYVNNVYYGVYLLTEELRSDYTQRYLNDANGDLYEWKPIADGYHFEWIPTCTTQVPLACSTDPAKWAPVPWNPEENKATFDLAPTISMIRGFTQVGDSDFERTVSAQLDLKLWLFHNAIETYISDYDSILGDVFGMNNFWLYRYAGTNFHQFLLWDKDSSYDYAKRSIFQNADRNVLMRRTLAIPGRRAQYLESMYKIAVLAGGPGGWLEWELQREYDMMAPSIREDPFKQYGDAGVTKDSNNKVFEAQVVKDFKFVQERNPFVLQELATAGLQYPSSLTLSPGGVVNAAPNSSLGPIAPGSFVSLYGSGFSDNTLQASSTPFPTTLGGVTVFVNGFAAPIQFVSRNQINIQVPWELGFGNGAAPFTVMVSGATARGTRAGSPVNGTFSNSVTSAVSQYSPGVFAAAQPDGTPVVSKPAKPGDVIVVFANGLGPVSNRPASGAVSPGSPLAKCEILPSVTIDGIGAPVQFAGLAPGFVGAYQINVTVPAGVKSGNAPLVVLAGGISAPPFSLAIQ